MPSTRTASFAPDVDTSRALPPASLELRAPADVAERADKRWRQQHPGKVGRPRNDEAEETAFSVFEALRAELAPRKLAAEIEATPERARALMKTAKSRIAAHIDEYVDIHLVAAKVAATEGDAKPAQWALENISVEGERAVDPPQKNLPPTAPTFNLGFVIGGMPQPVKQLPPGK